MRMHTVQSRCCSAWMLKLRTVAYCTVHVCVSPAVTTATSGRMTGDGANGASCPMHAGVATSASIDKIAACRTITARPPAPLSRRIHDDVGDRRARELRLVPRGSALLIRDAVDGD